MTAELKNTTPVEASNDGCAEFRLSTWWNRDCVALLWIVFGFFTAFFYYIHILRYPQYQEIVIVHALLLLIFLTYNLIVTFKNFGAFLRFKGEAVLRIDRIGVMDRRLCPGVIPWSKISRVVGLASARNQRIVLHLKHPESFNAPPSRIAKLYRDALLRLGLNPYSINVWTLDTDAKVVEEAIRRYQSKDTEAEQPRSSTMPIMPV